MNPRLSASVSTLFSGKQRRYVSREILICSSNMNLLNGKCRSFGSFQSQGFEALRRAEHNLSSQDDFSKLGPPVAGCAVTPLKLATEKPEPFVKTDPTGKASANSYKSIPKAQFGLHKNSESSGRDSPNQPLHAVKNVKIRIQGIAKETTDHTIHSICKSTGVLEGFARTGTDSVDALFRVTNRPDARGVVQRLNDIVVNDCHWSAYRIPEGLSSTTVSVSEEVVSKLGIGINSRLTELRKQFDSKKVYFDDLQILHMGIMHLEGLPTISYSFPED